MKFLNRYFLQIHVAIVLFGFAFFLPSPPLAHAEVKTPKDVETAVDRGSKYLLSQLDDKGTFTADKRTVFSPRLGLSALGGLALLESGVKPNHPQMKAIAESIRRRSPENDQVYDVALSIMFLDAYIRHRPLGKVVGTLANKPQRVRKLRSGRMVKGDEQVADSDLILKLGQRLIDSQGPRGTWSYKVGKPADGDNSNAQFAVIGVFLGTLHGLDGYKSLKMASLSFSRNVNADGGWPYRTNFANPSNPNRRIRRSEHSTRPSMTCAGLISLACAAGGQSFLKTQKPSKAELDQKVVAKRAFENLAQAMKKVDPSIIDQQVKNYEQQLKVQAKDKSEILSAVAEYRKRLERKTPVQSMYCIWSIERVGVFFSREKIETIDWYRWGYLYLLRQQQADGGWHGTYGSVVQTSFALLFLKRANISPDLTEAITGKFTIGPDVAPALEPKSDFAWQSVPDDKVKSTLEKFRDTKGAINTMHLAQAIRFFHGYKEEKIARQCLESRMGRMTSRTLISKLKGTDADVRAACLKVIQKERKFDTVPTLIDLLSHQDPSLRDQALFTLKHLSGKDFGPKPHHSLFERLQAIDNWKAWYKKTASGRSTP